MQSFVGRSIQDVMVYRGPPANAFDMPDGRRAFQWIDRNAHSAPVTVSDTGTAHVLGNSVVWTGNTRISGGQPVVARCVYTMFGVWSEAARAWMVSGFEPPKLGC